MKLAPARPVWQANLSDLVEGFDRLFFLETTSISIWTVNQGPFPAIVISVF